MKIVHTVGKHAGKIEAKPVDVARRLLSIGNARVPSAEDLAELDEVQPEPKAEAKKGGKKSGKK